MKKELTAIQLRKHLRTIYISGSTIRDCLKIAADSGFNWTYQDLNQNAFLGAEKEREIITSLYLKDDLDSYRQLQAQTLIKRIKSVSEQLNKLEEIEKTLECLDPKYSFVIENLSKLNKIYIELNKTYNEMINLIPKVEQNSANQIKENLIAQIEKLKLTKTNE